MRAVGRAARAGCLCLIVLATAAAAEDPRSHTAVQALRMHWMSQGEAALAAGAADAALEAFERAAGLQHAADAEVGIVRSHMQAGDYRRALAFGAHAAGAHRDHPEAIALYAWLLHRGGETLAADRYLRQALQGAPDDPSLLWVRSRVPEAAPGSPTELRPPGGPPPDGLAPVATGARVPADARTVGTATLAPGGLTAWVALRAVPAGGRLWLRNGLGQTVAAQVRHRDALRGIAELALVAPLPAPTMPEPSAPPFAGSPVALVAYESGPGSWPAWPLLRQGFLGAPASPSVRRALGIVAPAGLRGGPVFDRSGHLAGLALQGTPGMPDGLLSLADLAELAGPGEPSRPGPTTPTEDRDPMPRAGPPPVDAIYEAALVVALQVLAAD